uniref:SCP domain-containing protein n=1 Tax=Bursaphelenchus xylophilus TaxID=6326 RepID=A0A1I7SFW0_BURXY
MIGRLFLWAVLLQNVAVQALHHHDAVRAKLDLIKRNMDTRADPCNDFYTYAAGSLTYNDYDRDGTKHLMESNIGDEIRNVKEVKKLFADCVKNPAVMDEPGRTTIYNWIVMYFKTRGLIFPLKNEVVANDDVLFTDLVLEMYTHLFETGAPIFNKWGRGASMGKLSLEIPPKVDQEKAWQNYCRVVGGCANRVPYDRNYMAKGDEKSNYQRK